MELMLTETQAIYGQKRIEIGMDERAMLIGCAMLGEPLVIDGETLTPDKIVFKAGRTAREFRPAWCLWHEIAMS